MTLNMYQNSKLNAKKFKSVCKGFPTFIYEQNMLKKEKKYNNYFQNHLLCSNVYTYGLKMTIINRKKLIIIAENL